LHIKLVQIHNYRNFSNFEISFSSGFQTIVGENNVGKSNFYRAIRLVLDKTMSHKERTLEEKDFHRYSITGPDSFIAVSMTFYGEDLASFPNFHAIKTSDNSARITYVFAHKDHFRETDATERSAAIKDFKFSLFGGGDSMVLEDLVQLGQISLGTIEGIHLYYITAFRNIFSDLHGREKSLLSQYCLSRNTAEEELRQVNEIMEASSQRLNALPFVPEISDGIRQVSTRIAGQQYSLPISLSFQTDFEADSWNQLNLFFNPNPTSKIPVGVLGLGQKNILYLSLFLSRLIQERDAHELNVLLIEEPEAHLHPQLQKILFSNLSNLENTQVFMTSHSTHIASDCEFKNLNVIHLDLGGNVRSNSPFSNSCLTPRESLLLKRYLDATRSELFFASGVILVEGVAEQFIVPAIAKAVYSMNLTEHNISTIPIHSRQFAPFMKLFQVGQFEIPVATIIDGDISEISEDDDETNAVAAARTLSVPGRVEVFSGTHTLELDLFPNKEINQNFLKRTFEGLGHGKSFQNLIQCSPDEWHGGLISRIEERVGKGRFSQELALHLDRTFVVPQYVADAIRFIARCRGINATPQ